MAEDKTPAAVHQPNSLARVPRRRLARLSATTPGIARAMGFACVALIATAAGTIQSRESVTRDQRGVEMVFVPGTSFTMGSSEAGADARPAHEVMVSPFYIDLTEVTYAQFRAFLAENPQWRKETVEPSLADVYYLRDWTDLSYPPDLSNHPVVWVSWAAANAYAEWRGARLPTEAEWELAARGSDGRVWPWGSHAPDSGSTYYCNYRAGGRTGDGHVRTAPVGSFPRGVSPFGVFDMAGNVWEWTADWHDPEYYVESTSRDPTGPATGTYRVVRGGSWSVPAPWTRSTVRLRAPPSRCSDQVGFRCVAPID